MAQRREFDEQITLPLRPCKNCSRPFTPPLGTYSDPDDPWTHPGWMILFCSRGCAAIHDPSGIWGDDAQ